MLDESTLIYYLHLILLAYYHAIRRHGQESSSKMKNGTKAVTLLGLLSFSFLARMILRLFVFETFGLGLLGLAGILRTCNKKQSSCCEIQKWIVLVVTQLRRTEQNSFTTSQHSNSYREITQHVAWD